MDKILDLFNYEEGPFRVCDFCTEPPRKFSDTGNELRRSYKRDSRKNQMVETD